MYDDETRWTARLFLWAGIVIGLGIFASILLIGTALDIDPITLSCIPMGLCVFGFAAMLFCVAQLTRIKGEQK